VVAGAPANLTVKVPFNFALSANIIQRIDYPQGQGANAGELVASASGQTIIISKLSGQAFAPGTVGFVAALRFNIF